MADEHIEGQADGTANRFDKVPVVPGKTLECTEFEESYDA